MRAILIDPERTALTEIEIKGDGLQELYDLLGSNSITSGSLPLRGNLSTGYDDLAVSDDDMEDRESTRFWFQVDADQDPPASFPIAGRGLVMGVDKMGETCAAGISLDELTPRITFTRRKFRGFKTSTSVIGSEDTVVFQVDVDAPLLDGTDEKA